MSIKFGGKKQIIHVITDDKFVDSAYREFEATAPGQNEFVIIGEPKPLTYLSCIPVSFCSEDEFIGLVRGELCSAVVFHKLPQRVLSLLQEIPEGKLVFWIGWGFDYYDRLLADAFPSGFLLPKTKAFVARASPRRRQPLITALKNFLARQRTSERNLLKKQLSRIDYFLPVLDIEFEMALKLNVWFRPQYIDWNYGTAEADRGDSTIDASLMATNILVGNSAEPTNNHLEIFEILQRNVELSGRKVIVPLSYGQEWYRKKIIEEGKARFGAEFCPLTEFMSKSSYIDLIQSCGYVFMNHVRQQAIGNIRIMLLNGAKVYLNQQSPAYHWALRKGLYVESNKSLSDGCKGKKVILERLDGEKRQQNIETIMDLWGEVSMRKKTQRFVDIATGMV